MSETEQEQESERARERDREGGREREEIYMCFVKKMAFKNGSVVFCRPTLFPGASGKRGKVHSSHRRSWNKMSLGSSLPASSCIVPVLPTNLYLTGLLRALANKNDHKALGKITTTIKGYMQMWLGLSFWYVHEVFVCEMIQ